MIRLSAFADEISADPIEQVGVLERHGIKHIEFRAVHGTNVLDLSPAVHESFRALLRQRGFGLSAIASPIGKIKITDPFEPHLERFALALDLCDFYETPRLRIFSYYVPEGVAHEAVREEVMRRMRAKAEIAEERGISLFLENEKAIYGDTAARVFDILQDVDIPCLSSAFDPANFLEVGQPIDEAWALLRPKVLHFHVKDYDPDTHRNVLPGRGAGKIPELIADAVAHGYTGFCTLEPHLAVADKMFGFTGPQLFGEAAEALKAELMARNIEFA
ncbi:MAG TPA: sugar phosphate isomerase/epimerase [Isosphaeraceae bacterium]